MSTEVRAQQSVSSVQAWWRVVSRVAGHPAVITVFSSLLYLWLRSSRTVPDCTASNYAHVGLCLATLFVAYVAYLGTDRSFGLPTPTEWHNVPRGFAPSRPGYAVAAAWAAVPFAAFSRLLDRHPVLQALLAIALHAALSPACPMTELSLGVLLLSALYRLHDVFAA